jgi:dihydrodiol dehydrogenase / D-xylose 1-dehydrogenase (NADP)
LPQVAHDTASASRLDTQQPIGWGILGTGTVAQLFASDLACVPDVRLIAIGSRSKQKAREFGQKFGVPNQHGSYQQLANDRQVQAVYIATPASAHRENMLLCLNAGKPVLCEKPFTVNAREAEEVIALARRKKVFLMEAMWTRFVPLMVKVRDLLASGSIGEITQLIADVGTNVPFDPQGRVFNVELGGGALLQKGIYLLSLASMVLGSPTIVKSLAIRGETGVDEHTGVLLGYSGGQLASLVCLVRVHTQRGATIVGTGGYIRIHEPIICPSSLTLRRFPDRDCHHAGTGTGRSSQLRQALVRYGKRNRLVRRIREQSSKLSERLLYGIHSENVYDPPKGEGLHYQVSEVITCLRQGRIESEVMPLNESLSVMRTADQIREQRLSEVCKLAKEENPRTIDPRALPRALG